MAKRVRMRTNVREARLAMVVGCRKLLDRAPGGGLGANQKRTTKNDESQHFRPTEAAHTHTHTHTHKHTHTQKITKMFCVFCRAIFDSVCFLVFWCNCQGKAHAGHATGVLVVMINFHVSLS